MTALCFVGHSFKYELEAVTRLFIKIKHFDFYYDEVPEAENRIILRRKKCRSSLSFSCIIDLGDRHRRAFKKMPPDIGKDEEEYTLCRMLYDSLCSLTRLRPKWGMITGIRPVRMANKFLGAGYDRAGLYEHFRNRYDVSPEKLDLMYETARTQKALLEVDTKKSCAVYVSIPFCPQRCSYCSFVSQSIASAKHLIPEYLELLAREIRLTADFLKSYGLQVDSIYFGGGTPTSLEAEQLSFLMSAIEENFDLSSLREYCIEAGRADTITYEKCLAIKRGGADRISVNPQTFTDEVLFGVGRNIPAAMTLKAYEEARRAGIDTINMDFIAGLPGESPESFARTIDRAIDLKPENITVHTLTLKRSADLYMEWKTNINSPAEQMTDYAGKRLREAGYAPYYLYRQKNTLENLENVGYTLPGRAGIYNILIMEEIQSIIGMGAAASSKIVEANGKITRVHNYKFPYEYIRNFDKLMKKKFDGFAAVLG